MKRRFGGADQRHVNHAAAKQHSAQRQGVPARCAGGHGGHHQTAQLQVADDGPAGGVRGGLAPEVGGLAVVLADAGQRPKATFAQAYDGGYAMRVRRHFGQPRGGPRLHAGADSELDGAVGALGSRQGHKIRSGSASGVGEARDSRQAADGTPAGEDRVGGRRSGALRQDKAEACDDDARPVSPDGHGGRPPLPRLDPDEARVPGQGRG